MSLLDIDERLIDLADKIDIVYGPLVDVKTFPEHVDITLIEGAVSNRDDWEHVLTIRQNTKTLVSLGDCAVTGNVPAMRNAFSLVEVMQRGYIENVTCNPQIPEHEDLPALIGRVRPVHEVVHVDVFVPGCPPPADAIFFTLTELLAGNIPDINAYTRFGK
jgi:NAD-reducing hydrogenase small subunit